MIFSVGLIIATFARNSIDCRRCNVHTSFGSVSFRFDVQNKQMHIYIQDARRKFILILERSRATNINKKICTNAQMHTHELLSQFMIKPTNPYSVFMIQPIHTRCNEIGFYSDDYGSIHFHWCYVALYSLWTLYTRIRELCRIIWLPRTNGQGWMWEQLCVLCCIGRNGYAKDCSSVSFGGCSNGKKKRNEILLFRRSRMIIDLEQNKMPTDDRERENACGTNAKWYWILNYFFLFFSHFDFTTSKMDGASAFCILWQLQRKMQFFFLHNYRLTFRKIIIDAKQ